MNRIHLSLLIITIFIVSCSDQIVEKEKTQAEKAAEDTALMMDYMNQSKASGGFVARGYFSETPSDLGSPTTAKDFKGENIVSFTPTNKEVSSWRSIDKECRAYKAQLEGYKYAYKQLHNASAMTLDMFLLKVDENAHLKKEDKEGLKEAIAYHTEQLIASNTYECGVLAKSLKQLKGFWSDEKIEEVKQFGLAQSEKFTERRKGLRAFDQDLLDKIQFGGKKALEELR